MVAKKIDFDIESREGEEDRTTISINGIGEVVLVETFPEYEFIDDIDEDTLEELNVEEGDLIGKIEHLEINDKYKGQGYAKLLMKKAIEVAKEKGLMPLYLNASPMGSKKYGLNIEDLTGFYESLGFEVFLRQGGNNLMILKDTYKTGGETKNKIMAKQIKIQFADDNYAKGGITYSEWSKDDYWQEQFQEWMEDGNVTKNADGSYSTQDAQYTNSLRGIRELKKYFYNEFIKGQYDSYAGGGKINKSIGIYDLGMNLQNKYRYDDYLVDGKYYQIGKIGYAKKDVTPSYLPKIKKGTPYLVIGDGNVSKKEYDAVFTGKNRFLVKVDNVFYDDSDFSLVLLDEEYADGGSADDKHLIAKAIEFIIGSAIDTNSIEIEPTKISFKRKNTSVYSSLNNKLIEDTIRMHGKSLKGRYADGGETGFDDEGTSMGMYHEKKGNFIVPKGQIYLWLYDNEDGASKMNSGEYDYVFYPYASMSMAWQRGFIPPLKRIWTKKFQKEHKGSEHLLGVIKAYLIEEKGKKELFIDMMSVNPNSKKKGIMSYMIKDLRDTFNLTKDQVTFSELTKEGEKFVNKGKYEDGGETSGLITDEQVKDLSFKIKIKNVPLKKGVLLHEIITLEEFDLGDEKNINFYPFHLIYGDSSLAIFDAFGVDEVAGLKRADAEKKINELKAQGKTEKDGSFMAGLTNYVGDKLFMFFNVARLSYEGFANRVLPHEALHLSRNLISLLKNDWVRENLNTPKWWEDKRAVFVDMGDSNEEFFAETLERTTAIAMDGWYRVTGQKCVVEKNKTYADGGGVSIYNDYSRFPNRGEIVLPKDVDYEMMSFFNRMNIPLLITLKNGKKVEASAGKFYNDIIFHADFPKEINNQDYTLQLKQFQKIQVLNDNKYADGGSADEEMNFFVVIDSDDKNYNKVGYSLGETITDKEGNEFEKLYFENKKIPKKYSVNDISYLNDRGEFSKKNKITGTTNFVILVDYQEKEPYFYIYNLTEKFVATEGYNWSSIIKSAGIENSIYAHQIFADGGDVPHEDKMFQLPLEMVVYVPSTQDVDKVISVDKMDKRVDEVKEYLASKFGGYTSADKLGGFVDSTGNLVNEDVVQVTSFATKEAYAENKEELINQLAKWGKKWGQEAIGFEFEGDLMYVPQEL